MRPNLEFQGYFLSTYSARKLGLPYVYLGYWIANSAKMSYKIRFQPLEALRPTGWERMELIETVSAPIV